MTFEPTSNQLAFVLPISAAKCDCIFCSLLSDEEVKIPVSLIGQSRYTLSTDRLSKGYWRAVLCWSDGKHRFQEEKEIMIR